MWRGRRPSLSERGAPSTASAARQPERLLRPPPLLARRRLAGEAGAARRGGLIVRRRRKRRLRPAGTPGSAALPAGDWSARSPPRSGEGLGPAAGRLRAAGTHLRPPPLRGSGRHPRRWAGPGSAPSPVSAPGVGVGARVCVRGGGGWAAGPQDGGMRG